MLHIITWTLISLYIRCNSAAFHCVFPPVQALDGFMMIVSREGRILYVSESIANYLGLRQVYKNYIL